MRKIASLIKFFSKSMLKERATTIFIILALIMITVALTLSDINIARRFKLLEDILLTSQMFLLHIAALFYSFDFLQKEKNLGLFVLPLSTGISRKSYLLSIFLTLFFMITTIFLSFLIIDFILLFVLEGIFAYKVLWQLFLYMLSATLLSFFIIFFSNFVSVMNSIIYSVALFFIGNGIDEFYVYANFIKKDPTLEKISAIFYYILPNFSIFDKQALVVNRAFIDFKEFFIYPTVYFILLAILLFLISSIRYEKRVLRFGE